jgi:hypothetical protein
MREQCEKYADEYDKADKALKARFKLTKFDKLVIGGAEGFLVTKKVTPKQTRIAIERLKKSGAKAA